MKNVDEGQRTIIWKMVSLLESDGSAIPVSVASNLESHKERARARAGFRVRAFSSDR